MKVDQAIAILVKGIKQACGHPIIGMVQPHELDEAERVLCRRMNDNGMLFQGAPIEAVDPELDPEINTFG